MAAPCTGPSACWIISSINCGVEPIFGTVGTITVPAPAFSKACTCVAAAKALV
ncbi:hypothetical protein D3C80_1214470 [compost metagenome]